MSDPWLSPAQQHPGPPLPPAQPAPPSGFPQPVPAATTLPYGGAPQHVGGFGFPPPPVAAPSRRTNGIAVAALVVAVVALCGGRVLALTCGGSGFAQGRGRAMAGGYEVEGRLPQAGPGRVYAPHDVQTEVERVLEADWSTFEDLECEPLTFGPGAYTSCTGIVDDLETEIELDVVDDAGHFTLTQYW